MRLATRSSFGTAAEKKDKYERRQVGDLLPDEGSTDTLRVALKPRQVRFSSDICYKVLTRHLQMWVIALGGP